MDTTVVLTMIRVNYGVGEGMHMERVLFLLNGNFVVHQSKITAPWSIILNKEMKMEMEWVTFVLNSLQVNENFKKEAASWVTTGKDYTTVRNMLAFI